MDRIELSVRELILMALMEEVTEVIGIPDDFLGMDDGEVVAEFSNLQASLDAKGVASLDFEGNFSVDDEAKAIAECIYRCDRYIAIDGTIRDNTQSPVQFYIKNGRIVQLANKDNNLSIERTDAQKMGQAVLAGLELDTLKDTEIPKATLQQRALNEASEKILEGNEEEAEKLLRAGGCSESALSIVIRGLKKTEVFNTLFALNFDDRRHGAYSLVVLGSSEGALTMNADSDESDTYNLDAYTKDATTTQVKQILDKILEKKQ